MRLFRLVMLVAPMVLVVVACQTRKPARRFNEVDHPIRTTAFPGVVEIRNRNIVCTGTRIGENVILTSAHCVKDGAIRVRDQEMRLSVRVINTLGSGAENDNLDLAVLEADGWTSQEIFPIGNGINVGDSVRLVGYGQDEHGEFAKRTATNRVSRVNEFIELEFPKLLGLRGTLAEGGGGHGDSGGPLLKQFPDGYKIVGVVHSAVDESNPPSTQFTNLTRLDIRRWLYQTFTEHRQLKVAPF